jgi:hypothetical protein
MLMVLALCASVGCASGDDDGHPDQAASNLGKSCISAQFTPDPEICGAELTCSDEEPIGGFVCTRACETSSDCPGYGACYVFDGNDGHVCARMCQTDAECDALVPGLRCIELRNPLGVKACVE